MARVDMRGDWLTWQPSNPMEVLRPSEEYEGVCYPIAPSSHGVAVGVQQLRDPFVLAINKSLVMFYTGCGEECICGGNLILATNYSLPPCN